MIDHSTEFLEILAKTPRNRVPCESAGTKLCSADANIPPMLNDSTYTNF